VQSIAIQDVSGRDKNQNGRGWNDDEVMYTLDAAATQGVAYSIGFTQSDAARDVGNDVSPTLRSGGDGGYPNHSVAYSIREDAQANNFSATPLQVTPALQALRPSVQSHHAQTFIAQSEMAVRRLTPTECERLQGFPDNYTSIPWRGKPDSPDAPRYKAMGNSMAVPVMAWIGKRIQEVEDGKA
jgi:DNA (cytosine-5)-methyltransferase 1